MSKSFCENALRRILFAIDYYPPLLQNHTQRILDKYSTYPLRIKPQASRDNKKKTLIRLILKELRTLKRGQMLNKNGSWEELGAKILPH